MEQSSYCTASIGHYTDNVQEQTEDILVQRVTVHTAHLQSLVFFFSDENI